LAFCKSILGSNYGDQSKGKKAFRGGANGKWLRVDQVEEMAG
jgi:hypothetical protein